MTAHVSDLQWDRVLADELPADASAAACAHAGECAGCAARLRELIAERDAFRLRPITIALSRAQRQWWWRRWALPLVPVVAAAVVLIAIRARPSSKEEESPRLVAESIPNSERPKGHGPALLLAAGRPAALVPVVTGDVIRPSDFLQAGYTAARDGFGAVLSRDGAGGVTAYVPPSGSVMVPLPAGVERSFPKSTILDAVLGEERIVLMWCETMHPLEPLLASLRTGRAMVAPGDCVVREVTLDKRAKPL